MMMIDTDLHILKQVLIWTGHLILDTHENNLPAEHTAHEPFDRADFFLISEKSG